MANARLRRTVGGSVPLLLALLFAVVLDRPGAAQEKGEKLCGDCKSTGRIAHLHKESVLQREKDVLFCSCWMDRDPEALCMDWVVCPDCLTPSAQDRARQEFDREFGRRKAWLDAQRSSVDQVARSSSEHVETEHFVLSWDLPKIKVGRRIIKLHDAMHLYAERAEELYAYLLEMHAIEEQQTLGTKIRLYMFESRRAAATLAPYVTDIGLQGGTEVSKVGPGDSHMVWWDNREKVIDDEHRHQFFSHVVSHHIHNDIHQGDYTLWMFKKYGWVYEGMSFYVESRRFGTPKFTCSRETVGLAGHRAKSWEALVKRQVLSGEYPQFQLVITKSADSLEDDERRMAWSYIDYLMWLDPHRMVRMLTLMKGPQPPARDCLRDAYGMTVGQFVDGWLKFVREEYSLRPPKGPIVRQPMGKGVLAEKGED